MNFKSFLKKRIYLLAALCLAAASSLPAAATGASRSGLNIALAALGGKVESFTSQTDDGSFSADTLIDGRRSQTIGGDVNFCKPCGWRAADAKFPQELVFSFHEGREALVDTVIIDTASLSPLQGGIPVAARFPAGVEILVSSAKSPGDFSSVASQTLPPEAGEHIIAFSPSRARFVMVRINSTHGGKEPQLAEVKILEAAPPSLSIVADLLRDIASSALGGALALTPGGAYRNPPGSLLQEDGYWKSDKDKPPFEFVLAFNGDRPARIRHVVLEAADDPGSLPGEIVLYLSATTPLRGFREVGRGRFSGAGERLEIPVGTEGRFLKVEISGGDGNKNTALGRIRVFEEQSGDELSVLSAWFDETALAGNGEPIGMPAEDAGPNDSPSRAIRLIPGATARGVLSPPGAAHFYSFSLEGGEPRLVTVNLAGRTFAALYDDEGSPLEKEQPVRPGMDPGRTLPPGRYFLKVYKPPSSILLAWDASLSMEAMMRELKSAVTDYFPALPPETAINMIEYSGKIRTLQPSFSRDVGKLISSMEGAFKLGMGSALFDAMAEGIAMLEAEAGDRALVLFSDGGTQGSKTPPAEVWESLERAGVRVYVLGFGASLDDWNNELGTGAERMLKHFALAAGGSYLRTQSPEEISGLYRKIADDLEGDGSYSLSIAISGGAGMIEVAADMNNPETLKKLAPVIEIVFDASGSMNRRIGDKKSPRRIDLAKKSLAEVADSMPGDAIVAMRVFGHRIREGRKGDCQDTELLIPFGPLDRAKLKKAVGGIRALGTTPIAYSLKKAGGDLPPGPGERRILLITDGKEECGGDPAGAVMELRRAGIDVRVDVVGFDLEDEADREASRKVAEVSGGAFFDTTDGEGLKESILKTMNPVFEVIDAAGGIVARGSAGGGPVRVPEGEYRVSLNLADGPLTTGGVKIEYGKTTIVNLVMEDGKPGLRTDPPGEKK